MNFTLQIDSVPYTSKPKGAEIGTLKKRLSEQKPVTLTPEAFSEKVTQGYSFTPAVLIGGAKAENWQYQQIFGIDIDNEDKTVKGKHDKVIAPDPLTVEQVIARCGQWGIRPALIYETFSSTPEWQKFRIIFISEKALTDRQQTANVLTGFMGIFPECDPACKNLDRLFFGGKSVLYMDGSAILNDGNISALEQVGASLLSPPPRIAIRDDKLRELIQGFDFLEYIRQYYPAEEHRANNRILFNPCPVCGHKDDFWYYENEKTFMCFGANGNAGGTIIDFIMQTKHLDRKDAVKYFKYQLCGIDENRDKSDFRESKMIERYNAFAPADKQITELPPYIYTTENMKTGEVTYHVSCPLLADYFRRNNRYFWLRSQSGMKPLRYLYRQGVYKSVSDEEIKGILRNYITVFDNDLLKMRDIDEAFKNLCCDSIFHDPDELDADENVINFRNGLLRLDTMELMPHSPELLSTVQLPCNWTDKPAQTPVFDGFLHTLTNGNSEVIKLLIEYMGACISNVRGSRTKKALFLVGAGNTGKSQLRLLLERLIGSEHCSSASISDLEERFGTSALMGKRLVGSPDMSAMNVKELKMFKSITGGDSISVEFKGRDVFTYKFRGFLWNGANEMIKFGGDKGVHVYERMIIVRCENVIPEDKRDSSLLDKLYAERDGILYKLIQGLRDFTRRGYKFEIPEACRQENDRYKVENSSVLTFYKECCCEREKAYDGCTRSKMYEVFKAWAKANSEFVPSKSKFWEELAGYLTSGEVDKLFKSSKGYVYPVFTVTVETKTTYREAYGYDNVAS